MDYELYVADTETTGLDNRKNDVIEISLLRVSDSSQRTWTLRPLNVESAEPAALRVNGHKLEDLKLETKFGKETYRDPNIVLVEIENWIAEDGVPAENRVLVGQNIGFDKEMLEQLWIKCNAKDSFPFGRRTMDTMVIEFFLNYCQNKLADSYSLSALVKKYGVVNSKAHSAEADVKATKEVFDKQVDFFRKKLIE